MINGGGAAQVINRDIKIMEGAFKRLITSKMEATNFEERLNQAETLHKQMKYSLYDTDCAVEDKSQL